MDYNFSQEDVLKRDVPTLGKKEPNYDIEVSKIVGKKILATDAKLLHLIIKWKAGKGQYSTQPDNFLNQKDKVDELKRAFA